MTRMSKDEYFAAMLQLVAARSTCVRRAVGAIFTDKNGHILSTGYNGVPSGFPHCTDSPCAGAEDPKGDSRRCMAIHAEVNAVLQCSRLDLLNTAYVSCMSCFGCAKMLCNTNLRRLVVLEEYADTEGLWTLKKHGLIEIVLFTSPPTVKLGLSENVRIGSGSK